MPALKRARELNDDNESIKIEQASSSALPASSAHHPDSDISHIYPQVSSQSTVSECKYESDQPDIHCKSDPEVHGFGQERHKRARYDTPVKSIKDEEKSTFIPSMPAGMRPPPSTATKLPKHFEKPLACFFWSTSRCSKTAETCIYAHWHTGNVAEPPVRVGSSGTVVAGPDAERAVGDALELREHLRKKEQDIRKREVAVKKRERDVEDRERRVDEKGWRLENWERTLEGRERRVDDAWDGLMEREQEMWRW